MRSYRSSGETDLDTLFLHKTKAIILAVSLLLLCGSPEATSADPVFPDPFVREMIEQVESDTAYDTVAGLSGEHPVMISGSPYTLKTRFILEQEPIQKATQLVYEYFQSIGLPVEFFWYSHTFVGTQRSVIAEQPGRSEPDCIYVLSAHLDDAPSGELAPGADDNASGSAGVLIAASILSQYEFNCSLRYALFTAEELGLLGSKAYAEQVYNLGEDIRGVVNLDMIAYNSDEWPVINLHTRATNDQDLAIANQFENVVSAYAIDLLPEIISDGATNSDQASFWKYDFPAILAIEDGDDLTPFYHSTSDRVQTLDLAYFTHFIQAAVGTTAHLAGLLEGRMSGLAYDVQTGVPLAGVVVTAQRATGLTWSVTTAEDGSYSIDLPSGKYSLTASLTGYGDLIIDETDIPVDQTAQLDLPLQICQAPQTIDFSFSPEIPRVGDLMTFSASVSGTDGLPVDYQWSLGDNHSANGQIVTHIYTRSRVYPVMLTASTCGGSGTSIQDIQIDPAPVSIYLPLLNGNQQ
jgi:hypothetical protein